MDEKGEEIICDEAHSFLDCTIKREGLEILIGKDNYKIG